MDNSNEAIEEECMALEAIFMESFSQLDARRIRVVVEPQEDRCEDLKGAQLASHLITLLKICYTLDQLKRPPEARFGWLPRLVNRVGNRASRRVSPGKKGEYCFVYAGVQQGQIFRESQKQAARLKLTMVGPRWPILFYPEIVPEFDLSNHNNAAFTPSAREMIISGLKEEANAQMGEQMVYNLVEWLRENLPKFVEGCLRETGPGHTGNASQPTEVEHEGSKEGKKEKMTKAQKRRHYDRFGAAEEKPRGWDWVDILSHLAKKPP